MVAKRYFESLGYRVTLVENITDIDDRIIQKGLAEGGRLGEVADEFAQAYREDTDRLGLGRPDMEPLATEHIHEIIALIAELVERGTRTSRGPTCISRWIASLNTASSPSSRVAEMRHGARIDPGEARPTRWISPCGRARNRESRRGTAPGDPGDPAGTSSARP